LDRIVIFLALLAESISTGFGLEERVNLPLSDVGPHIGRQFVVRGGIYTPSTGSIGSFWRHRLWTRPGKGVAYLPQGGRLSVLASGTSWKVSPQIEFRKQAECLH